MDAYPGLGAQKVLQSFPKFSYQFLTSKEEILLLIKGVSCVHSTLCAWLHPFQHHCEEGKSIIPILQVRHLRLRDVKYSDQCHTAFLQDWGDCARLDTPSSLCLCFFLSLSFFLLLFIYLFGCASSCLQQAGSLIFVAVCEIFGLQHVGSSSLTRNQTQGPCIGSMES